MSLFPAQETVPATADAPWSAYAGAKKRCSAGKAWLFSIIPGVGQIYCGAGMRGPVILAAFLIGAGVAIFVTNDYRWTGVRLLVMLYALVPYDAYETARELNVGMDADAPDNPRVAALLNLTTNGFGYFYIGHRLRVVFFIVMAVVWRVLMRQVPLLAEIIAAILAIHVWKLAERKREEVYPRALRPQTVETTLPRAVPVLASIFILGSYYVLCIIGQIAMFTSG